MGTIWDRVGTKRDQVRHKWVPVGTRWSPDGTRWGLEAKALVFKSGFRRELGVQKGPATPSSPTHPPPSPPQDAPRHHLRRPTPAPEDGPGRTQARQGAPKAHPDAPRRPKTGQGTTSRVPSGDHVGAIKEKELIKKNLPCSSTAE